MDTSHFAYGHLGCSYFSIVIKNAGISINVFIYAYFFISLEYRFRSWIAGFYDNSVYFLRNYQSSRLVHHFISTFPPAIIWRFRTLYNFTLLIVYLSYYSHASGSKGILSFLRPAVTNYHKLSNLKQEKFILSQFWILEVFNQNVSKVILSLKPLTENHILLLVSRVASNP